MPYRIVVATGTFPRLDQDQRRLGATAELWERDLSAASDVASLTEDADAVVVARQSLGPDHVAALAKSVRVIGRAGIGLDSIDLESAAHRGIAVLYQPDYATGEVATHALAMMLALRRQLVRADHLARTDWAAWRRELPPIRAMEESTVGVVGCGRIGRAVIDRLRPLAKRIVAFDPFMDETPDGVDRVAIVEDLLSISDVVTLHLPLTDGSRTLIDERMLELLPVGALLINVSRGGLVDEDAVAAALESGALGGAGFDAFTMEPIDAHSRLAKAPNALLSPHLAWYSESSSRRLRELTFDGVVQFLRGDLVTAGRLAN